MCFLKEKKKKNCKPTSPVKKAKKRKMAEKQLNKKAHQEATSSQRNHKKERVVA